MATEPHLNTAASKEEVSLGIIANSSHEDEDVFESDDEEDKDDVFKSSVVGDEDESDWEDYATDTSASPTDELSFQLVDLKPNLLSQRSLLTKMIQSDRAAITAQPKYRQSRTSTLKGPSIAPEDDSDLETQSPDVARSRPIVMTQSTLRSLAFSPCTTRRNMLGTELSASLRKGLLWERQEKYTVINTTLKRRHTAHNMDNPTKYPKASGFSNTSKNNSWNHSFDQSPGDYHSSGW